MLLVLLLAGTGTASHFRLHENLSCAGNIASMKHSNKILVFQGIKKTGAGLRSGRAVQATALMQSGQMV